MAKRRRPSPLPAGPALVSAVALVAGAGCPERKRAERQVPPQVNYAPYDDAPVLGVPPQVAPSDANEPIPPPPMIDALSPAPPDKPAKPK